MMRIERSLQIDCNVDLLPLDADLVISRRHCDVIDDNRWQLVRELGDSVSDQADRVSMTLVVFLLVQGLKKKREK